MIKSKIGPIDRKVTPLRSNAALVCNMPHQLHAILGQDNRFDVSRVKWRLGGATDVGEFVRQMIDKYNGKRHQHE